MRQVNAAGLALIKRHERLMLTAYDDLQPKKRLQPGDRVRGTLTIGWGHTGPEVAIGQSVTVAEAERLLAQDLAEAEGDVERLASVPLHDNEFAALVSLVFNIGGGAFATSSVRRRLNAGDRLGAAAAFALWRKSKGRVLPGLVRRRAEEAALFLTAATADEPAGQGGKAKGARAMRARPQAPSETPAQVSEDHDLGRRLRGAAGGLFAGGGAAGLGTWWRELQPQLAGALPWLLAGLALAAAAGVWWWQERRLKALRTALEARA